MIGKDFGKEFLPESPNTYKSKKEAQDAHEAIRPTSVARHPDADEAVSCRKTSSRSTSSSGSALSPRR